MEVNLHWIFILDSDLNANSADRKLSYHVYLFVCLGLTQCTLALTLIQVIYTRVHFMIVCVRVYLIKCLCSVYVRASVSVWVCTGWLVGLLYIIFMSSFYSLFFAFHINRTKSVWEWQERMYVYVNVYVRAQVYLLIRQKTKNKKRIVTGFNGHRKLIALHKLRCYYDRYFVCMCFMHGSGCRCFSATLFVLALLLGFCITFSLNSLRCSVIVWVRVCVWVWLCLYLHPLWFFKSLNTHSTLTNTYSQTENEIVYLFSFFLLFSKYMISTHLPIWFGGNQVWLQK